MPGKMQGAQDQDLRPSQGESHTNSPDSEQHDVDYRNPGSPGVRQDSPVTKDQEEYIELPPKDTIQNGEDPHSSMEAFFPRWNKADNFSGRRYSVLDDTIRKFIKTCKLAGIPEDHYYALFPFILEGHALKYFYDRNYYLEATFSGMYRVLDEHYNSNIRRADYFAEWSSYTWGNARAHNPDKEPVEVLDALVHRLSTIQRVLGDAFKGENRLLAQVRRACGGVPWLRPAFLKNKDTVEGFVVDIRELIIARQATTQPSTANQPSPSSSRKGKRCYACNKSGCWSTKHNARHQERAFETFVHTMEAAGVGTPDRNAYAAFLTRYEGHESDGESTTEWKDRSITR
ncbi:hypothetical protein F5Y17DRAFT_422508 [Xylariaceae sp. FL0594]|nr:hypothetical protein F5Y17DRAFT_422508 [Xylariaceae sp. FL0594]